MYNNQSSRDSSRAQLKNIIKECLVDMVKDKISNNPQEPQINRNNCNKDKIKEHYILVDKYILGGNLATVSGVESTVKNQKSNILIDLAQTSFKNIKKISLHKVRLNGFQGPSGTHPYDYIDNPNVYLELYDPNNTSETRYRYNLDSIYLKVNDFNRMILLENTYDSNNNVNINVNNKYYFTNIPLYPEIYNGYNTYNITNNVTSHKVDIFNSMNYKFTKEEFIFSPPRDFLTNLNLTFSIMKERNIYPTGDTTNYTVEKKEEILKLCNDFSGNLCFNIQENSDINTKYSPLFTVRNFELTFKIEEDCTSNIRNRNYF